MNVAGDRRARVFLEGATSDLWISRKRFLSLLGVSATGLSLGSCTREGGEAESVEERVSGVIAAYDSQSIHRTGTEGDQICARWLADEVDRLGVASSLEALPFRMIDVVECSLDISGRRIEGVPLFNAPPTTQDGIAGRPCPPRLADGN